VISESERNSVREAERRERFPHSHAALVNGIERIEKNTKTIRESRDPIRRSATIVQNAKVFVFLSLTEGCGGFLMLGGMKCLLVFPFTFPIFCVFSLLRFFKVCLCGDTCEEEVDSCKKVVDRKCGT